ncbi:helix-turn-helix domain-containing protein [Gracilibacillus salitolerans]|uniref:Helix-turn-helix domain-containing protein n=1 Tax=Gracilibacillus salitolerans TaxID=2663022 RepID=A0A5Q2TFN9_9BACI|nr:helix-turn-helix domain-containing protein [Gracilibacillus salitolerans]QGH32941.1 helix-turn-helix domain-containing protein [Gracilibacillus salitolerans]
MKRIESSKIFRRFLISYLVILIIPMVAGFISYQTSLDTAQKYSIINSKQVLDQSKKVLEQNLDEIDRFVLQLSVDSDLNNILKINASDKNKAISTLKQLDNKISSYAATNEFLKDFYIYLKEPELIVTPGSVYYRPYHFYADNYYTDMTMTEWEDNILNKERQIVPSEPYMEGDTSTNVITYVQPLPMNDLSVHHGSIIIPIENPMLNNLLEGVEEQFKGWAFILDENHQLITANGIDKEDIAPLKEKVINDEGPLYLDDNTMLITEKSEKNDWLYVAGIPNETLLQEAAPIKYKTWIIIGITFIIGLFICLFFAYRNSRPINNVIKTLKEYTDPEAKNDYDFLHGNVSKLISTNTDLQMQLTEQKPLLKDAFLKQLLSGEISESNSNLHEFAKQTDVNLSSNSGYVAVLKVEGYEDMSSSEIYEELNAIRIVIQQESMKICDKFYVTNIHSDKLVYIFLDQKDLESLKENIEKMFTSLTNLLQNDYRVLLKIGIGHPFVTIPDISRSYNEAKQAMDFAVFTNQLEGIYWYDDMMKETAVFHFPLEYEFRLLKNLKEGDTTESEKIIHELFEENVEKRSLSTEMHEQFIYELRGTFYKALDHYVFRNDRTAESLREKLRNLSFEEGMSAIKDRLLEVLHLYCDYVNNNRKESNHYIVNAIKDYVHEHFSCAELTIYLISEHFSRPEKYISQIFKEETGEYLYEYLEKIRMEEALHLLANSSRTINDIAEQVGYNSAHSFRRAFKRVHNMTPNQFRKTLN